MLNGTMKTAFRDALIYHFEKNGTKVVDLVSGSGVGRGKINKLLRRENATVEVQDAIGIALFYGMTVPQFLRKDQEASPNSLDELAELLPPEERRRFEAEIVKAAAERLKDLR